MGAGSAGMDLPVVYGFEGMRVGGMPFAPARGIDLVIHVGVHINDRRIRTPGTAEKDGAGDGGIGGELAVVKEKAGVLLGIVLGLRGEVAAGVRGGVNLAVLEDGFAVAEDEVDVAGDVAIGEVLARGDAILRVVAAVRAEIDRVLIAEQAVVVEDGAVAGDENRESLRALRSL